MYTRLFSFAVFVCLASLAGAQAIFSENFEITPGSLNGGPGGQFITRHDLVYGASLAGWSVAGDSTIHAVDTANTWSGGLGSTVSINTPNWGVMIWQNNVITQQSGIVGSNTLGSQYSIDFLGAGAVYHDPDQVNNGTTDNLQIQLLRASDNAILQTFNQVVAQPIGDGNLGLTSYNFNYTGDGTGDVLFRIGPGIPDAGRFQGTIDDLQLTLSFDMTSLQQSFRVQDLTPRLTNSTLNGAHHRLLMDTAPSVDGWHAWVTGDYANLDEVEATQYVGEFGASKSLYDDAVRLGIGAGHTVADQDSAFGGGAEIDGQFLITESNFRVPNSNFILSGIIYYGDFDAETSRGYLLGGAKSVGETDVNSLAMRIRTDWKNFYTTEKLSITPRLSYTFINTTADAYTETGGATPASFEKQTSQEHELRLGFDIDYNFTKQTQLRSLIELVHRFNDEEMLQGTAGATSFNLANRDIDDTWGRLGFDLIHQINDRTNVTCSIFGATEGGDATLSSAIGINRSF